jgi:ATP-binding cassette subfamily B protein
MKIGEDISVLFLPVSVYLGLTLFTVVIFRCYDYIWLNINPGIKKNIADRLMSRMMQHSHSLFQNNFTGALSNRIKDVMSAVPDILKLSIDQFLSDILALVIASFAFYTISYKFSLILGAWSLMFCTGSFLLSKHARRLCEDAALERSKVVGQIVDILTNMMSVRLFSARKFESKNFHKSLDSYVNSDKKRDKYFMFMYTFQGMSFFLYESVCIMYLVYGFQEGVITAGDFILVLTINGSLIECLWSLSEDIGKFAEYYGNIDQGLQIALSPVEIKDHDNAIDITESIKSYDITFDNVRFHYKGASALFSRKSITIKTGQKVGLVGYSGSGKSTFVNLILRLYDINEGSIMIGGYDIREVKQDSLREIIGIIPQDPSLFHRTLMDNIRYGRIDASDAEVVEAAQMAHAHDFIMDMPEGYESMVGERGVKLSGGQRQRIAMARAVLKNAPILVLDEATSQLDSITEKQIQESLWHLMKGKTSIVIAHRLSTLLSMDRILVFEKGKIVQDGSHEELLAQEGLYKTMWSAQVCGFLPDAGSL